MASDMASDQGKDKEQLAKERRERFGDKGIDGIKKTFRFDAPQDKNEGGKK